MSISHIYRIADQNIRITSIHDMVHEYCRDYLVENDVPREECIQVRTSQEDIDRERKWSEKEDILEGRPVRKWSDAYLEELAVYRILAEQMPEHDTFLMHGSAVSVDGNAYLFTAKSGIGKSTHVRLWQELLGDRAVVVNDDKPLIRIEENQAVVFGTPYNGKHRSGNNISATLKAICLIGRDDENHIEKLSQKDAFPLLLQQSYRSDDPIIMNKIIMLATKLTDLVQFWKMGCNMDISAAQMAYDAMSRSNSRDQ